MVDLRLSRCIIEVFGILLSEFHCLEVLVLTACHVLMIVIDEGILVLILD